MDTNSELTSVPEVDVRPEGDGQDVVVRPVEEIQVVVVDDLGRVEDPLRVLRDVPPDLKLGQRGVTRVEDLERVGVRVRGRGRLGRVAQDLLRAG